MGNSTELDLLRRALDVERGTQRERYASMVTTAPVRARVADGLAWYPVRIRETGFGFGEYPYVVVERPPGTHGSHQLGGGKPCQVFSLAEREQRSIDGVFHFVNNGVAHVVLRANDHPDWLDDGRIGVQVAFDASGFRDMDEALVAVAKADETSRLGILRDTIYGDRRPEIADAASMAPHTAAVGALNPSQQAALALALRSRDVAVIHGPPGTGKTTTLVATIAALARQAKPILVCAPSNSAVDLLTERCAEAGLDVLRIGNVARIDPSVMRHTLGEAWKRHGLADTIKQLKSRADEFRRMALKYKRSFGKAEAEQRRLLLAEARSIMADARRLEEQVSTMILDSVDVVACTPVAARNQELAGRMFPVAVIDEAGQGLDPALWIPLARCERVILAGDPHQLPPTVMSQEATSMGLGRTMLERLTERRPEAVALLTEQYRMNATIMQFSNDVFYDGMVTCHPDVEHHVLPTGAPERSSLTVIDTSGRGWDEEAGDGDQSLANPGEAACVLAVLDELAAYAEAPTMSVGVISPYRGQVRHLVDAMGDRWATAFASLDVNTVDSFQGSECDVIVISLVRSNRDSDIGFLKDIRRMNVAMTRARRKLVIIGDGSTVATHPFYERLLRYVEERGTLVSAWELGVEG